MQLSDFPKSNITPQAMYEVFTDFYENCGDDEVDGEIVETIDEEAFLAGLKQMMDTYIKEQAPTPPPSGTGDDDFKKQAIAESKKYAPAPGPYAFQKGVDWAMANALQAELTRLKAKLTACEESHREIGKHQAETEAELTRLREAGESPELMEQLAEIEHDRWAGQAKTALNEMTDERRERWGKLSNTPYKELSEHYKELDRLQVREYLSVIQQAIKAGGGR